MLIAAKLHEGVQESLNKVNSFLSARKLYVFSLEPDQCIFETCIFIYAVAGLNLFSIWKNNF